MTVNELLLSYIEGETDAISAIRALSGIFDPNVAINYLVIICQITRIEQGDLEKDLFVKLYKLKENEEGEKDEIL